MARQMVDPSRLDLESPGRRDYWVALPHDSIWGEWLIPLTVWVGSRAQEGEGLVAFGSTHGDEYEGPVALKHLLRAIDGSTVTGAGRAGSRPESSGLPVWQAGECGR